MYSRNVSILLSIYFVVDNMKRKIFNLRIDSRLLISIITPSYHETEKPLNEESSHGIRRLYTVSV